MSTPPAPAAPLPRDDRRTIDAWAMFDWANSAYALVITTAIFPAYYASLSDEPVRLLGGTWDLATLFSYALSAAYLALALASPLLSGIADASGKRLAFLRAFTLVGAVACMGMWWFEGVERLGLGTALFVVATIGYSGALVFYNAFLPLIASEDRYDAVSARGFAFGYVGSLLLLLASLGFILNPGWIGLPAGATGTATRVAFVLVGVWWLGFAQIPLRRLPPDARAPMPAGWLRRGYREIALTWADARARPLLIRFLAAFFFYSAGVQTVLFLASTFASTELGFETTELIVVVLLLQLLAIGGALLFARVSRAYGNVNALLGMLAIWSAVCVLAYFVVDKAAFYAVAALVGLVMGGIQSLSRSTYSKLLPADTTDTTSYFSFYDLLEKVAVVVGTFSFGLINEVTGGMRLSMLSLIAFFAAGMGLLWNVRVREGREGVRVGKG